MSAMSNLDLLCTSRAQRRHPVKPQHIEAPSRLLGPLLARFYDAHAFDIYITTGMEIDPAERAEIARICPTQLADYDF
jgi:hypothetical protein